MFYLEKQKFGSLDCYKFAKGGTDFSASFLPGFGGMLNAFKVNIHSKSVDLIEGYSDIDDLIKNHSIFFRSGKLSPFPNRIKKGKYSFAGNDYQLLCNFPKEGNSIHGLVYNKSFSVVKTECQEEKAVLVLSLNCNGSEPGYPFRYELTIEYVIEFNKLLCRTTIRNKDSEKIPMGDGWHPYFSLAKRIDELQLQLPESFVFDDGKSTNHTSCYSPKKIGQEKFDTCFRLSENKTGSEIKLTDPENNFLLNVWQECGENKYNYFQLYIPPSRKSIAIEPMTCPPDAFNSKEGLIVLEPDEEINLSFGFEISSQ